MNAEGNMKIKISDIEGLVVENDKDALLPCPFCGSVNTTRDRFTRTRQNIILLLLFNWLLLLIKGAFSKRTDFCRDCEKLNRYKSTGSWIAMAALFLLILLAVVDVLSRTHK